MPDVFTPVILKLQEIGAFNFFFPFMLTSAVFYGLLRKSQIFGKPEENTAVNGVIALMVSFMVWAYPIMSGVDIEAQMSSFFMHGMVITLVLMVSIMLIGMFAPPDLPKHLANTILKGNKFGAILVLGLFFGFLVFFSSGIYTIVFGQGFGGGAVSSDIGLTIGVILLLVLPLIFIVWGGGKSAPAPSEKKSE
ncbi:MAG: hypothetical protein J7J93_02345 [Candidatus Aenigmarchaeota archaeon]|nr:hypothetical protein [Candidatus Aenigmarchaeota archaeon]